MCILAHQWVHQHPQDTRHPPQVQAGAPTDAGGEPRPRLRRLLPPPPSRRRPPVLSRPQQVRAARLRPSSQNCPVQLLAARP